MSRWLTRLIGIALLAGALPAPASEIEYLFRNDRVCDDTGAFCLSGTLSYQPNPRLLRLRARVQTAPGPGLLRIRLTGSTRLGMRRLAPLEVRVRGDYSEIINHKMVPDYPDALEWAVDHVEFDAD